MLNDLFYKSQTSIFAEEIAALSMFDTLRNILAFISTFTATSTSTMLLLQVVIYLATWNREYKKSVDHKVIIIGIIVALILIPFYYLPV